MCRGPYLRQLDEAVAEAGGLLHGVGHHERGQFVTHSMLVKFAICGCQSTSAVCGNEGAFYRIGAAYPMLLALGAVAGERWILSLGQCWRSPESVPSSSWKPA
jgi:hypothetical protein